MRATRDLLRRRLHLTRKRAALLAPIQHPNSPYTLPAMGQKRADQANREGVVERCSDPAVQQRVAVKLALSGCNDQWLSDVALTIVQTAKPHDAHTLHRLPAVPGLGQMLRVVRR